MLDALRRPLESGQVIIARSGMTARFPARFTLVIAANPCPCAKSATSGSACTCPRYLGRLSGPLLERAMDLGQVSARGTDRIIRMSWTLADQAGQPRPGRADISAALGVWLGAGM